MSSFVFQNKTVVYFGRDQLGDLPYVVRKYGKHILIVTGKASAEKNGTLRQILELMEGFQFDISMFCGIGSNPTDRQISEVIACCRDNRADVIIAVGGGSVIDSAKAVSAVAPSEYDSAWTFFGSTRSIDSVIPVIAIPTTIGTGSEMNGGAVITNEELGIKRGMGAGELQPVAAFYDPDFTKELSLKQIGAGAADIIAHIMDSGYLSNYRQMGFLRSVQKEVIVSVIDNATELMKNRGNPEARENLMWASAWGLNGFLSENLKQDASIHRIEHQISADHNVPHGEGIAVVMPRWLRYCIEEDTLDQIVTFGTDCFGVKKLKDRYRMAEETVEQLEDFLYEKLMLEKRLESFGIRESEIGTLAKRIVREGPIKGFKLLEEDDIYNILKVCI